eukprot:14613193-Alexandrium_andersonii.AAC.1
MLPSALVPEANAAHIGPSQVPRQVLALVPEANAAPSEQPRCPLRWCPRRTPHRHTGPPERMHLLDRGARTHVNADLVR